MLSSSHHQNMNKVKYLVMDVDGTLTDEKIYSYRPMSGIKKWWYQVVRPAKGM